MTATAANVNHDIGGGGGGWGGRMPVVLMAYAEVAMLVPSPAEQLPAGQQERVFTSAHYLVDGGVVPRFRGNARRSWSVRRVAQAQLPVVVPSQPEEAAPIIYITTHSMRDDVDNKVVVVPATISVKLQPHTILLTLLAGTSTGCGVEWHVSPRLCRVPLMIIRGFGLLLLVGGTPPAAPWPGEATVDVVGRVVAWWGDCAESAPIPSWPCELSPQANTDPSSTRRP